MCRATYKIKENLNMQNNSSTVSDVPQKITYSIKLFFFKLDALKLISALIFSVPENNKYGYWD